MLAGSPRTVERLPGGLTNLNLKVTTPDGRYVVRLFQGDADLLGIDRDAEHQNSVAAAEAGVGAEVLDYLPDLGMLVIGHIEGTTYDNASFARPGVITRVAGACLTLHHGPRFVNEPLRPDKYLRMAAVVRRQGVTAMTGIGLAAARRPHATAIIDERGALTWAELEARSNALASPST